MAKQNYGMIAELTGIKFITDRVEPIEVAAEHPLLVKVAQGDFDNCEQEFYMVKTVADEFELSATEIVCAIEVCKENMRGGNG